MKSVVRAVLVSLVVDAVGVGSNPLKNVLSSLKIPVKSNPDLDIVDN